MPKKCTDPRCPVNKYHSLTKKPQKKSFCKIHGKPSVTFASEDEPEDHRERKRIKYSPRSNKAKDKQKETKRDRSNSRCCKNKKCSAYKHTAERHTPTHSRSKARIISDNATRSHASRKSRMQFHSGKDKGRPCECGHKKRCTGEEGSAFRGRSGKGIRRYRSRHKRKKKCTWLRNCWRRLCICAKTPSSSESDTYSRPRATLNRRNSKCSCMSKEKHGESLSKSRNSRKRTSLANNKNSRENESSNRKYQCRANCRALPADQPYLQGAFSRGLNVMRGSTNFCI